MSWPAPAEYEGPEDAPQRSACRQLGRSGIRRRLGRLPLRALRGRLGSHPRLGSLCLILGPLRSSFSLLEGYLQPGQLAFAFRVSTERQGRSGLGLGAQLAAVARHVTTTAGQVV